MKVLAEETSLDPGALFGDRVVEPTQLSPQAAHAVGVIEGMAIMSGITALEFSTKRISDAAMPETVVGS